MMSNKQDSGKLETTHGDNLEVRYGDILQTR